jgi:NAD+ synthase
MDARVLDLDCEAEAERIARRLVEIVGRDLRRRGAVVAVSGGIDSSVCCALATRALGREHVFAVLLPERDSSPRSTQLGERLVGHLGVAHERHDIAPALEAIGCYRLRDQAIRAVFPDYGPGWKNKIVIGGGLDGGLNFHRLVVEDPRRQRFDRRIPPREYLQMVAAQNFKQRLRKSVEYYHADRLAYAVVGTPNRLEYDQGFFVKNGDGAADVKPIAHLYKTQVYALARHLGLPAEICAARPTTDTFSLEQGQDEFYFALPYEKMDLALWAYVHAVPAGELGEAIGVDATRAARVYQDIERKRQAAHYLASPPLLV